LGTAVAVVSAAPLISRLEPHGEKKMFVYAGWVIQVGCICFCMCLAWSSVIFVGFGILITSVGAGLWIPSYKIALAKMEPPERQGSLQAAIACVTLVGSIGGTVGFGSLIKLIGTGSECDESGSDTPASLPFICITCVFFTSTISAMLWVSGTKEGTLREVLCFRLASIHAEEVVVSASSPVPAEVVGKLPEPLIIAPVGVEDVASASPSPVRTGVVGKLPEPLILAPVGQVEQASPVSPPQQLPALRIPPGLQARYQGASLSDVASVQGSS